MKTASARAPGDASGEALEAPSLGAPLGGADDLEPEVSRRRVHVVQK